MSLLLLAVPVRACCACHGQPASPPASATRRCARPSATAAGGERRQARVMAQERIAAAERERAVRPAQAGRGAPGARQRPAHRVRGAHAGRRAPGAARERQRPPGRAVVGLVDGRLGVRVDARGAEQAALGADEAELAPGGRGAALGQARLAERDDVLGQRQPLRERLPAATGGGQVALRRGDPGEPGQRGRVVRARRRGRPAGRAARRGGRRARARARRAAPAPRRRSRVPRRRRRRRGASRRRRRSRSPCSSRR